MSARADRMLHLMIDAWLRLERNRGRVAESVRIAGSEEIHCGICGASVVVDGARGLCAGCSATVLV